MPTVAFVFYTKHRKHAQKRAVPPHCTLTVHGLYAAFAREAAAAGATAFVAWAGAPCPLCVQAAITRMKKAPRRCGALQPASKGPSSFNLQLLLQRAVIVKDDKITNVHPYRIAGMQLPIGIGISNHAHRLPTEIHAGSR